MPHENKKEKTEAELPRVRLTVQLTIDAYDAITEIQKRHRRKTGKVLPAWEIIDQAVKAYARTHGIKVEE